MKRGFTTLELMFVIGVALLVITALLGGFINFMVLNEHNRNLTIAMNIARDKMEAIFLQRDTGNFDAINNATYTSNDANPPSLSAPVPDGYGVPIGWGWSCNVAVTDIPNTSNSLKFITISVSWRERGGRTITNGVVLNSAVSRR
jgi:type II secretory pathway pseudopilin PulG